LNLQKLNRKGVAMMKFIFTERKTSLSDEVKAYAEKKLSKLDKYFRKDAVAYVTAGVERGRHWLEVTVKHDSMFFRAKEKGEDICRAIDDAETTIDRQIRKNKTRLEKRLREGAFDMSYSAPEAEDSVEEEKEFDVVRTKRFSVKPMTVEEAILQMNLLGHSFFVFKSMDEEMFSVVYRRKDGGYGLIEGE